MFLDIVLSLAEVLVIGSFFFFALLLLFKEIHFFLSELVEVDNGFDDGDGGSGYTVEVLDHIPLLQAVSEDTETLDHPLPVGQVKISDSHVHIT